MDSGNLAPKVSGKKVAQIPPNKLEPPIMINGAVPLNPASNGAATPPSLEIMEAVPMAVFLMIVGYNSAVYKYTTANEALAPNLPEMTLGIQNRGGVKLEFVRNSFDSIRKFAIRLIRKGKKYSKNSMKINSKFVRFDSTPTIGCTVNTLQ